MTIEQFKKEFGIIAVSKEINDLVDVVMQVAKSDISVLIIWRKRGWKRSFCTGNSWF